MGGKSEALAKQFEAKGQEAAAVLEKLSDADWKKVTEAERWTVGVTAHHLAGVLEPISDAVKAIVTGQSLLFTNDMIDEMNAKHAKDYANCTKAETIVLLRKGVAVAAAVVRGLSDDQLAKRGTVSTDAPPMTAEQVITGGLITHLDEHFGSIRRTVGMPSDRELVITRVFDAPRRLVFKAWIDPRHVAQWWGPHGFTNPVCELDVRPGGAIRIHMRGPDGTLYPMTGVYQEIVEPQRLVFTSAALDKEGNPLFEVLTTVTFAEQDDKTTLTLQAHVVKSTAEAAPYLEGMEAGWAQSLERLEEHMAKV